MNIINFLVVRGFGIDEDIWLSMVERDDCAAFFEFGFFCIVDKIAF